MGGGRKDTANLANDDLVRAIKDLDSSVRTLSAGLRQQSLTIAHVSAMTGQILEAVTNREEGSPLVDALRALIAVSEQNTAGIERIERLLTNRIGH